MLLAVNDRARAAQSRSDPKRSGAKAVGGRCARCEVPVAALHGLGVPSWTSGLAGINSRQMRVAPYGAHVEQHDQR